MAIAILHRSESVKSSKVYKCRTGSRTGDKVGYKQTGVGDGQGGLAFCGSWGCKELRRWRVRAGGS